MRITVLGCGASAGVPVIGCDCAVCQSSHPRNKRSRVSVHVESNGSSLLIDSAPDLRQQALRHGITRVDGVFYTHGHADHTHGIDDLKAFNFQKNGPISAFGDAATLVELKERFAYAFQPPKPDFGWFRPCLEPQEIPVPANEKPAPVQLGEMEILPFLQRHGRHFSLGARIGNFSYSTDTNHLPESAFEALKDVEIWMVDCLRLEAAPTHAHLELALSWIERVKPRLAILTHMSHELEYEALAAMLPEGVVPGYDGMTVDC